MTKDILRQYCWIKKNIENLTDEIEVMESRATSMTTIITDEPRGGNGDSGRTKLCNHVVNIIELKAKLQKEINRLYSTRTDIEDAISPLPEQYKYLIRMRYVYGHRWEKIAVEMGYSWRQMHRLHKDALRKIGNM